MYINVLRILYNYCTQKIIIEDSLKKKGEPSKSRVLHTVHVPVDVLESSKGLCMQFPFSFHHLRCYSISPAIFPKPKLPLSETSRPLPPLRIPFIRASRAPLNGTPDTPTIPSQPLDAQRLSRPRNLAIITYAAPNKSGGSKPETEGEGASSGMPNRELRRLPLFEPCAKSMEI